ncbi:MAG: DNA methyltransferase [Gammaproteobacteria bacterium]|nr:DNA methyltransferase [Gammaproteobacteria bacterium]
MRDIVIPAVIDDPDLLAKSLFNNRRETRIEGTIPTNLLVTNNQKFLFISKDQQRYTHGLHKYPAKFFPELPRWIIDRYSSKGDTILDPFMGSGTTNLEAGLLGRNSIGVDVDPFSRFLSKVKTTQLPENELLKAHEVVVNAIGKYGKRNHVNGIPSFPYRDKWFKPYILKELSFIKSVIETIQYSQDIKDFFLICFSSIIRAVSEADNNCTRTVIRKKLAKQVNEGDAIRLFLKRLDRNIKGMIALGQSDMSGNVFIPNDADARAMPSVHSDSIDLAITSPPYMNAVDYPRTHQLEMYWLGFASGSLAPLKKLHIGTEVVSVVDYNSLHKTQSKLANRAIEAIYQCDPRRAYIASKYIDDMQANLEETYRVLQPGKRYVVIVGDNLVRGVRFETWKYLKQIAPKVGFRVEKNFVSAIINHFIKVPRAERINDDHILVLKK